MNRRLVVLAVFAFLAACGGGNSPPADEANSPLAAAQAPLSATTRIYENGQLVSRDPADTPAQVFRLYKASFNRESDAEGLGYHVGHIESLGQQLTDIAGNFVASPEFTSKYGPLTNEAFVTQLYQNVLGRAPDAGGLAFHVGNLSSGTLSRAQTLVGFSESPENKANTAAAVAAGIHFVPWQPPVAAIDPDAPGAIASADVVAIPSGSSFADSFVATNRGLYMRLFDATGATGLLKLHGNPIFSNAWSPISFSGGELMTWAPANTLTEVDREVSVYYVTQRPDPANPNKSIGTYTSYTENTGGPGFTETDDLGILRIITGPGPEAANYAFRPWAKTAFALYGETGEFGGGRITSDRFLNVIADPDGAVNPATGVKAPLDLSASVPMSSNPTDSTVFAGEGNTLYEIGRFSVISRTQLPATNSFTGVSNMQWANGELFFAYDGKIWRRSYDGKITQFAVLDALLGGFGQQEGLFCIQGGEVLMRGGTAKSIYWGTERPWLIRPGTLTPDQQLKSVYFKVLGGVYCTPQGNGVYGIAGNNVVFIQPLP